MSCLYILEINPLLIVLFPNVFSQFLGCLFLFMVPFAVQKLLNLAVCVPSVVQLCSSLCDPMDYSLPGSFVQSGMPPSSRHMISACSVTITVPAQPRDP